MTNAVCDIHFVNFSEQFHAQEGEGSYFYGDGYSPALECTHFNRNVGDGSAAAE